MRAVVKVARCVLRRAPDPASEPVDEILLGWEAELLEAADNWVRLRTDYCYEGFAFADCLELSKERVALWQTLSKAVFCRSAGDILPQPCYQSAALLTAHPGGLVAVAAPLSQTAEWPRIILPDGREGFVRSARTLALCTAPDFSNPGAFRRRVCRSALSYLGVPYRWGGKTPQGIDCSGLTFMAYRLNGVSIYRDAVLNEDFPMVRIPLSHLLPGDLLYYPDHVALYLGKERYIHATGRADADGVVINSLRPGDTAFRPDLARNRILAAGRLKNLCAR